MQHLLKDDTQVYKQFVENESFHERFVMRAAGDMVQPSPDTPRRLQTPTRKRHTATVSSGKGTQKRSG
jgi:hypothetical protein